MNTCPTCEYEIEFVAGTEGIGKYTVCPQCAGVLITNDDGALTKITKSQYDELPEHRVLVIETLQRVVSETPGYQKWFSKALAGLVANFVDGAISKGLAREETVPAILTLFHMAIEKMEVMDKIKWLVKLVDSMGDVRVEVMKMNDPSGDAKDVN